MKPHKIVLSLIVLALCAFMHSCKVSGTSPFSAGMPVCGVVEAIDGQNHAILFARSDGDTTIAMSSANGRAYIFDKASGVTVLGPVLFENPNEVVLVSKSRDFKSKYAPGAPLPAWVLDTGIFRDGEAAQLGLTFEQEQPAVAALRRVAPPNPTSPIKIISTTTGPHQ